MYVAAIAEVNPPIILNNCVCLRAYSRTYIRMTVTLSLLIRNRAAQVQRIGGQIEAPSQMKTVAMGHHLKVVLVLFKGVSKWEGGYVRRVDFHIHLHLYDRILLLLDEYSCRKTIIIGGG